MSRSSPSRRAFLRGGLLFGAAAAVFWQVGGRRLGSSTTKYDYSPVALSPAAFGALVAACRELLDDELAGFRSAEGLDAYLGTAGVAAAKELNLALTLLEYAPAGPLTTRRFSRMPRERAAATLVAWSRSSIGVRRQIHSALRQASRFFWFDRPEAWAALDYDGPWVGR